MASKFKVGGIYKLSYDEDLYPFFEKNKHEYRSSELRTNSYESVKKGTVVTFIKTITEIVRFRNGKQKNWQERKYQMPVFYYNDKLVVSYTTYDDMVESVFEVVDETP